MENFNRTVINNIKSNSNKTSLKPIRDVETNNIKTNAKLDSAKIAFSIPYRNNGITYRSNDPAVIARDEAGNVILLEGEQNQLLRIEPIATNITTTSMLKVLDTQFTYYKFPTSYPIETTLDLDLDTNIELDSIDDVYARYRPGESFRIQKAAGTWSDEAKFNGFSFDFVEDGVTQKRAGHYFITPEIKNSGVDLRFRIKIEHRYDTTIVPVALAPNENNQLQVEYSSGFGTCYFSLIKNSPITGLNKLFKGPFANSSVTTGNWGEIFQYEVQTLNLDLVILNEEFLEGDYFQLGGFAGQNDDTSYHTIGEIQSYWVITDASKNVDTWNQEI